MKRLWGGVPPGGGGAGREVEAEVVGFSGERIFLMPTGDIRGLMPGARGAVEHCF